VITEAADPARRLHVGDTLLDGRGRNQRLSASVDAAPILRMQQHAA
jgi:hypothetical protein